MPVAFLSSHGEIQNQDRRGAMPQTLEQARSVAKTTERTQP
jgi:hypothetical protein